MSRCGSSIWVENEKGVVAPKTDTATICETDPSSLDRNPFFSLFSLTLRPPLVGLCYGERYMRCSIPHAFVSVEDHGL